MHGFVEHYIKKCLKQGTMCTAVNIIISLVVIIESLFELPFNMRIKINNLLFKLKQRFLVFNISKILLIVSWTFMKSMESRKSIS